MDPPNRSPWPGLGPLVRSFATKLIVLLTIFLALPIIVYVELQQADQDKNALLLRSVQEEGQLIARGLLPVLESFQGGTAQELVRALARMGQARTRIKLLFRPRTAWNPENFYYVAAAPEVSADYLDRERDDLIQSGILAKLPRSCEGGSALAQRYTNPVGTEEILTSITPINIRAGCWVVITSHATADVLARAIDQPYWQTPEVRIALMIYLAMAAAVISLFLGIWRNLRRFATLARTIRTGARTDQSFVALNRIPELLGVAQEFDHLVEALHQSADRIRQAAEENAHALKGPLAVITQALEPLRADGNGADDRRRRALELIERSVTKLDAVVSAARQMDEVAAELIDPPRRKVDLSRLVEAILAGYPASLGQPGARLEWNIEPGINVIANEDLIETVIENLLDNAVSFSPPDGKVVVTLGRSGRFAQLTVEDHGPGVPADRLDRIFERYYTERPQTAASTAPAEADDGQPHFGVGLWVARRNVESIGGTIRAHNRDGGGLCMTVRLLLAL